MLRVGEGGEAPLGLTASTRRWYVRPGVRPCGWVGGEEERKGEVKGDIQYSVCKFVLLDSFSIH